jgi:hypothetical protein
MIHSGPQRMPLVPRSVRGVTVGYQLKSGSGLHLGKEQVEHPRERLAVTSRSAVFGAWSPTLQGLFAASSMRRALETVHEPTAFSDRRTDPEWVVLRVRECFEVVVDHGFFDRFKTFERTRVKKHRMTSEASRLAGDRTRRTTQRTGELAVGRACVEPSRDRFEQFRTFQIVGRSKSLRGKGLSTGLASESPNDARCTKPGVNAALGKPGRKCTWTI